MKQLLSILILSFSFTSLAHCPESENIQCEDIIRQNLPRWERNDSKILKKISIACSANLNTSCLETSMAYLPRWDKDEASEMIKIASNCKRVTTSCLEYSIESMPEWDFNDFSEVINTAKACQDSDTACVKQKCESSKLRNDCSDFNTMRRVARSCAVYCSNH